MEKDFLLLNLGMLKNAYISSRKLLEYWKLLERELKIIAPNLEYDSRNWKRVLRHLKSSFLPKEFKEYVSSYQLWKDEIIKLHEFLANSQIKILSWWDDDFPVQLKYINDPPIFLFLWGNAEHLKSFSDLFAFVGTRTPSLYGRKLTKALVWQASLIGGKTVSGYAAGIDTLVFEESNKYKVPTIAVLPYLPDSFPYHRKDKSQNILFISEYFSPQAANAKWMYVERNRIIAALATATFIVEAPPRSGALITADFAYSYHRYVYYSAQSIENRLGIGGLLHSVTHNEGRVITSIYDALLYIDEERAELFNINFNNFIENYVKKVVPLNEKFVPKSKLEISLRSKDITKSIWDWCGKSLQTFQSIVIELKRLDMILEYKGKILINFIFHP